MLLGRLEGESLRRLWPEVAAAIVLLAAWAGAASEEKIFIKEWRGQLQRLSLGKWYNWFEVPPQFLAKDCSLQDPRSVQHARRLTKRRPPAEHWLCASRWDGTLHPTVHFYSALGTEPHLAEFTDLWHARVETERPRKAQDAESTASQAAVGRGWGGGGGKRPWNPGRASIPRKLRLFLGGKPKGGRWGACGVRNWKLGRGFGGLNGPGPRWSTKRICDLWRRFQAQVGEVNGILSQRR